MKIKTDPPFLPSIHSTILQFLLPKISHTGDKRGERFVVKYNRKRETHKEADRERETEKGETERGKEREEEREHDRERCSDKVLYT